LPIARKQLGFISIAFHQSIEANETMMYWDWESKADHEACMASEDWRIVMEQSNSVFSVDGIEFSLETFERIA